MEEKSVFIIDTQNVRLVEARDHNEAQRYAYEKYGRVGTSVKFATTRDMVNLFLEDKGMVMEQADE